MPEADVETSRPFRPFPALSNRFVEGQEFLSTRAPDTPVTKERITMCSEEEYHSARKRLLDLACLYSEWYIWLADYCRKNADGTSDVPGFTLQAHELQTLGVDEDELLSRLMAGDTADPFVRGALSFDYIDADGSLCSAAPGNSLEAVHLERLLLRPDPQYLPVSVFLHALKQSCLVFRIPYTDLLFRYRGYLCEDPVRTARILCSYRDDIGQFLKELRSWHHSCGAFLKYITPPEKLTGGGPGNFAADSPLSVEEVAPLICPGYIHALEEHDPRLRILIPRTAIARILGVTTKTLYRWELAGKAVNGLPWPKPECHKGRYAMYYLPLYLQAMQGLVPRYSDIGPARQTQDEG